MEMQLLLKYRFFFVESENHINLFNFMQFDLYQKICHLFVFEKYYNFNSRNKTNNEFILMNGLTHQ